MGTRTKSKDRRSRIANKLYETHIKQKVRLGGINNVIQLYVDSVGNIMRLAKNDRSVTRSNILKLYAEQNGKCNYCKVYLPLYEMHKDHITPLIRGGVHSISNIQLLCPRCNLKKGKLTHDEYFDFLS